MRIVGIDPGKDGAYALHDGQTITHAACFPHVRADVDWRELRDRIAALKPDLCVIEKVGAMPGQGVVSTFAFGYIAGKTDGLLTALDVALELVPPVAWKKHVLAGFPRPLKTGNAKDDRAAARKQAKDNIIQWATQRYPRVNLLPTPRSTVPHNGIADAMGIAHWAALRHAGIQSAPF